MQLEWVNPYDNGNLSDYWILRYDYQNLCLVNAKSGAGRIILDYKTYEFVVQGEFDKPWREQLLNIVREDIIEHFRQSHSI